MTERYLDDQVIVVTGGSRGIGRAIVLGAIELGARVAFCTRGLGHAAEAVRAEAELLGGSGKAIAVRADISCEADVNFLFDTALDTFGRVDAAINNAGISRQSLLVSLTTKMWDETIATNLTGAFLVGRRAIIEFVKSGHGGRIVSLGSLMQNGAPSNTSYAASKGGLMGLTRSIAAQYSRHAINANLVVTGYVETELTKDLADSAKQRLIENCPQKRAASADEIASVVLFLASERAKCINGEAIFVSGGLLEVSL
jgi:3-oxoacyl-[acyl-carrier protein] reductase